MKRKTNHKKSRCENGHRQQDVTKRSIVDKRGRLIGQRSVCRSCRQTLDVDCHQNLIGNPFGIIERTEKEKDRSVLNEVDKSLRRPFLVNVVIGGKPFITADECEKFHGIKS